MRGRPLCMVCLLFLLIQIVVIRGFRLGSAWNPSELEKTVRDGSVITVVGKVTHKEMKKDNLVVILTTKQYQTKIIVYFKQENLTNISIGNEIQVTGKVAFFDIARNLGNFNQKAFYMKDGISGKVFAIKYKIIDRHENIWQERLARLRAGWKNIFIKNLGKEKGNMMSAMLLGDKSELDPELKELYQKNGIGHVLAISGLHMTFIGLGVYKLLRKFGFSFLCAGILGMSFLVSYAVMIGLGVASVRALIMFIVRIGADITGRVYDMFTALALAAMVLVIGQPLYLYDAGFLLSFGAILGILFIHPIYLSEKKKGEKSSKRIKKKIGLAIWGSISINLMILPCMLYFYYEIPPYSILINVIVIPLMSVVLGAGMIGSFLHSMIPIIGNFVGEKVLWLSSPILNVYQYLCEFCNRLPGSHIIIGRPMIWQIVVYYILIGLFIAIKRKRGEQDKRQKRLSIICIMIAILVLCVRWNDLISFNQRLSITVLDVGQGDGIVIKNPNGSVCMIDGGSSDVLEVGKNRIEPFLKVQGISKLNYVFLSHGDSDHYSGIEELLKRQQMGIRIECLILPVKEVWDEEIRKMAKIALQNKTEVVIIKPGQTVAGISCLMPSSDYKGEIGNASSMVLSLSYGRFDMLLTGDVEGEGEEKLLEILKNEKQIEIPRYEVLKVAHHGSKNSSSKEILEIIKPQYSILSAGRKNRYGHPHKETMQRLENVNSKTIATPQSGGVTIQTNGKTFTIEGEIEYNK